VFVLFLSIFILFLKTPKYLPVTFSTEPQALSTEPQALSTEPQALFLQLLLFWLISFGIPASALLSGIGIFVFSIFVFLTLLLLTFALEQSPILFCVPFFVLIQTMTVRQMGRFSQEKHRYYLDTEKVRETMNDLKENIETLS
jgi:hypothetical protein